MLGRNYFWVRLTAMAVALVAIQPASPSFGQVNVELNELQQAYAEAFIEVLDRWESGDLVFFRGDGFQATFEARLEAFEVARQDDRLEQVFSPEFLRQSFDLIPAEVGGQVGLSPGARLVMLASIVDVADELRQLEISPDADSLIGTLEFSLYLSLAAAQEEAVARGGVEVTSVDVRRSGVWLFSFGWPFCCAVEFLQ